MFMLLSIEETAQYLGLRPATIRRWVFERRLPTVKLGRRVLIRRDVVDDLVRRSERAAVPRGAAKL
jgi:excisionase family DNA binding protein